MDGTGLVDKIKLNRDQIRFVLGKFAKIGEAPTVAQLDRKIQAMKEAKKGTIQFGNIVLMEGRLQLLRNRLKAAQPPSKRD